MLCGISIFPSVKSLTTSSTADSWLTSLLAVSAPATTIHLWWCLQEQHHVETGWSPFCFTVMLKRSYFKMIPTSLVLINGLIFFISWHKTKILFWKQHLIQAVKSVGKKKCSKNAATSSVHTHVRSVWTGGLCAHSGWSSVFNDMNTHAKHGDFNMLQPLPNNSNEYWGLFIIHAV